MISRQSDDRNVGLMSPRSMANARSKEKNQIANNVR